MKSLVKFNFRGFDIMAKVSKKQTKMEGKKRPCKFQMMNGSGEVKSGLFHQWGFDFYETSDETFQITIGIVEDHQGNIHKADPEAIQFRDK
jgi:hypothetical protein